MEIKDLAGVSEPLKKLIEVVSNGVGALSKPYLIRKTADAKAYEIKAIAEAIKDNQHDLKNIGFNEEKISLMSLDENSIALESSVECRTKQRIDFKEQKRQSNIESITQKAACSLDSEENVSEEPVDEDWTTRFFNYAEDISSEEMQGLWAKILAGEIKKPKSYSLRALDVLRNLSTEDAEIFIKFGAFAIISSGSAFILDPSNEKFLEDEHKLNFGDRLLLEELGLLTLNILSYKIGKTDNVPDNVVFTVGNVIGVQNKLPNKPEQMLRVLVFTKIGKELLQLVNTTPNLNYLQLLATKLNRNNGKIQYANIIKELPNGQISHMPLIDIPLTEREKEEQNRKEQAMKQ